MSCDLRRPEAPRLRVPRPRRRDPRGGDFINGPTPRDRCHNQPTRYTCVHSYAKLGAARSWVFSTARQLTPWDAYFGSNSTMWSVVVVQHRVWTSELMVWRGRADRWIITGAPPPPVCGASVEEGRGARVRVRDAPSRQPSAVGRSVDDGKRGGTRGHLSCGMDHGIRLFGVSCSDAAARRGRPSDCDVPGPLHWSSGWAAWDRFGCVMRYLFYSGFAKSVISRSH